MLLDSCQQICGKRGFTLIELLLVVALIAILAAATTPFLSRFVLQTNHDAVVDEVIGSLQKAQGYAMDGRADETWGVCVTSGVIRLYASSCGSPVQSEEFALPGSIAVSGLNDISFNQRGEPSSAASITVSSDLGSVAITLNTAGGLDVQ